MADATVALESYPYPKGVDNTQRRQIIYGTATITPVDGTAPATGLPLDWSAILDGNNNGVGTLQPQVSPFNPNPVEVSFQTAGDGATPKQLYTYDTTDVSLIVWSAGAPAVTGILADTIRFKAEFLRQV